VTVWRKLKALGALYLQQSVCLLPERPSTRREIGRLTEHVHRDGGVVRVLLIECAGQAQSAQLRDEFRAARDDEYGEVLQRFPTFFAELEMETARGRATFEEVEESEVDLARFRSWLAKIAARDYFGAPRGDSARAELARAEAAMAAFAETAMAADDQQSEGNLPARRLRAIEP
jgi:hypothetical protein